MRYWIQNANILDSDEHTAEVEEESEAIFLCMALNASPIYQRHHIYDTGSGEFVTPEKAMERLKQLDDLFPST